MVDYFQRNCPVCDSVSSKNLEKYSRENWNNVQCNTCGFIYLNRAPVYEALSQELAWTKQFKIEKKRRKKKQPIIAWLDEKTRWRLHINRDDEWAYISDHISEGRVLDVGCGSANRIPAQFTPFGIEIEKEAAKLSNMEMSRAGGRTIHAPALEGLGQFSENFFDGIIMRSYLEHEAQPKQVLEQTMKVLRPGGVVYIKVPNFATINRVVRGNNWCGFRYPDHLNYFTIASMRNLAKKVGFEFKLRNIATRYTNDNLHCFLTKPEHTRVNVKGSCQRDRRRGAPIRIRT